MKKKVAWWVRLKSWKMSSKRHYKPTLVLNNNFHKLLTLWDRLQGFVSILKPEMSALSSCKGRSVTWKVTYTRLMGGLSISRENSICESPNSTRAKTCLKLFKLRRMRWSRRPKHKRYRSRIYSKSSSWPNQQLETVAARLVSSQSPCERRKPTQKSLKRRQRSCARLWRRARRTSWRRKLISGWS